MYNNENLRVITNTGNNGGNLYFYFNNDGSDITATGFFKDVRLSVGDVVVAYNGEEIAEYQVDSASGNDKTVVILRDVSTIKTDLDDLGDQVQGLEANVQVLEAKLPTPPTEAGTYGLTVTVAEGAAPVYAWTASE